ncbi:DUF1499 domain-containing protein [Xanthobacter sp. KR7-225]|uniref:DUF1499 domain-containing protein n=1 Tax=Xanthobacter sp. KR7-225 TaxID=3156613 RepID=UPI0032B47D75
MIKRRLYTEERQSPLAQWSFRLVLFSVPVILLSAGLYRLGLLEFRPAVTTLVVGLAMALLGGILGTVAFFIIWESGWRGIGKAMASAAIAFVLVAGPAAVLARGLVLPRLADITTDLEDPPRFHALALARPREANPIAYQPSDPPGAQRAAYPAIKPQDLSATPEEAFNGLLALIQKRRWRIIDATPPRGARRDGRIEAVATSPVMGFRSDVVIRIRSTPKGARVDARSASRYGEHDLGSNAERIESLLAELSSERRKQR